MKINKPSRGFYFFNGFLVLTFLCVLSAQGMAANYPLEIIQPQPNLDIKNRFYKAYPGLEYNVRLAVIGGEFPYLFSLTTGPTGMTIDKRGEISWANPVASGTPYNVTATVTDAQSNTRSVSWTITVTKSGFRFIDAVNGKSAALGGTGTFGNPWKSMKDWYEGDDAGAVDRNSYSGEFLYWRGGTYTMDAALDANKSVLMKGGNKPHVWLAYPGESPVLDMNRAHLVVWHGENIYMDGIEFNVNGNPRGMGLWLPGNVNHVSIRRSKFHGITKGFAGGNNALFFMSKAGQGQYWSFQDNEMYDVNNGYGVLGYNGKNILVADNIFHGIGGHAVGPKSGTQRWEIRGNVFFNNGIDAIGVQYYGTQDWLSGDIEIRYNLVKSGGGRIRINSNQDLVGYPVYVYRNTIVGEMGIAKVTGNNGMFYFSKNIIVNNRPEIDKIAKLNIEVPSRLTIENNLVGSSADNIVDADGYLTSNYSEYVGTRGHQLGHRPSAPSELSVVSQ